MTTCPWERNSPHNIVIIIEKGCFVMVFGGGTYWNQTDFFRKAGELLNIFWECCGFQAEHRKSTVQALCQAICHDII